MPLSPSAGNALAPVLVLVAGPNGAGKTELTRKVLAHKWLAGCRYINPDEIAQNLYGDWNSPEAVRKAADHAAELRRACLSDRQSMAVETVFSTPEKIDFVHEAKAAGFFVRLFFVATENPEINAARVARRVMQGGHDVPIAKIISRHSKSIANLARILPTVNRAYVYDNSFDDVAPALQFRTVDGGLKKTYTTGRAWADEVRESHLQAATAPAPEKQSPAPCT